MQGHPALAVPFRPRDLGTAEAPADIDPDPLRTELHRRLHRALQRTPEGDAALQLPRDVLGHQLRVDLRLADLDDVQHDVAAARHLAELLAQLLDVGALLADDDARARRMYRDPRLLRRALDHHAADAGLAEPLEQVLAQTPILMELRSEEHTSETQSLMRIP